MPIVNAKDGCPINYQVEGPANAPVLMLCNSLGTNLHMWDEQAAAWSKHFRLVRYDRRGHGKSGAPKGPYTMDMLGHDALAVADAAGAKKFNWCGLSMGGMVGQWMGANARDRVEKLVLSNTHYYYADKQPWHDRIKFAARQRPGEALRPADGALVHQGLPRRARRGRSARWSRCSPRPSSTASSAAARRCATWTSAPRRRPSPRRPW